MTKYGIQMYSIRDLSKDDLKEALRRVAEMGYAFVEFAGFFDHSAEEVKGWLEEFGLTCSGTHTGIKAILPETIDETIRYHKAIGCDTLIVPSADWKTEEDLAKTVATLNEAQKKLKENGITLGYHNHSREFVTAPYGKVVEEVFLQETDVKLEVDTFWAWNAGIDPVAFLEAHKDRLCAVHLKDGIGSPLENKNFANVQHDVVGKSLGEGQAPVVAVRNWAVAHNVPIVVESENLDPNGTEEVKRCIEFLKTLG